MTRTVFNLDELDELNPEPAEFVIGGRTLLLGEIPHQQLLHMQEEAASMQTALQGHTADAAIVQQAMRQLVGILVDLFAPFNDSIDAETFDALTPRKLMFLIEKSFLCQMSMAGVDTGNGGPPAMAGSRPPGPRSTKR